MSSMEQHLQQEIGQNMFGERSSIPLEKKWKSLSSSANATDEGENNPIEGFDCNICLDPVQDPVVTFCGHLYCWPCIYKWINSQTVLSELDTDEHKQHPQCPVCKDEVSEKTLIPLYGRGLAPKSSSEMTIPQRPQSPRCGGHVLLPLPTTTATSSPLSPLRSHPQPPPPLVHQQPYHPNTFIGSAMQLGGTTANGMFGEMVYTRMFGGNSETTLYSYPNSYNNLAAGSNLRMRRQMMNADRSLSRICFFLFCCLVLCFLLF